MRHIRDPLKELPERVSHAEFRKTSQLRGLADRVLGLLVLGSGLICLLAVVSAVLFTELGSYTRHFVTDLIAFGFISASGVYFVNKGYFLIKVFLCRFCLARIPEGSTYCPHCRADLLSNKNPQTD